MNDLSVLIEPNVIGVLDQSKLIFRQVTYIHQYNICVNPTLTFCLRRHFAIDTPFISRIFVM